ncbi:MAG: hypothetical protein R6U84_09145 [Candidatus Cloacimonadales bacterium]
MKRDGTNNFWQRIKPKLVFWLPLAALVVAMNFIFLGIASDEFSEMVSKAITLCLG